jgi:PKD repeat protein
MSDTSLPPENDEKKWAHSLLSDILKASQKQTAATLSGTEKVQGEIKPWEKNISKKEAISLGVFLKLIASLLFISIIFFWSFLAYIAFNPDQAVFFTRTFNIDPNDVQNLLKKLINGSFGFVMVIISIVWIVTLFRAFWVPKELKRKRLLSWLTAAVVGIVLFLILAFWAFLFTKVGATDYSNPDGTILIYDQNLYINEKFKESSRIYDTANIIGPIDIFFDIRGNAEQLARNNLYVIESFDMNFDGAKCSNGWSTIRGANPQTEQSTICTFSETKAYNIVWSYTVRSRDGTVKDVPMVLPSIEIRGLVSIKNQENSRGQKIVTFDATSLKKLWSPKWIFESSGKEVNETTITEVVTPIPQWLCLKVFESRGCNRLFLLEDKNNKSVEWSITAIQDATDKKLFRFSLSWVTLNENSIVNIEWLLDNQNIICKWNSEICDYSFSTYGRRNLKATVKMASNESYTFETEVVVNEPLSIIRHIKVVNDAGDLMNNDSTYDTSLRAYILKNAIIPPESLTFDARDIVSWNAWYALTNVLWKISNGKNSEERRWEKISIEFNQPLRYTIEAYYTFKKSVPGENDIEETLKETVVVDIERRSLMPRMNITKTSDYIPSLVTIDASQSESEEGEIKKFIFDFWEWRVPAEWDSIQQYEYKTPGEKNIVLTIIAENGEKTSLKKTIVLKDQVKSIDFTPSIQPGISWNPIDFEAAGTTWQVEDYVWNFGDNTPVSRGFSTAHTYEKTWTYTIELTVIYSDGTQQRKKKTFEVKDSF